jgi:hypothetical protein
MALFRDKNIREKYQLYLNGAGVSAASYQPKRGSGRAFKITAGEAEEICKQYKENIGIYTIASNVNRSSDSIRNVLKRAGVYEKPIEVYTKTKTVRV